jgi:hypothetical protein
MGKSEGCNEAAFEEARMGNQRRFISEVTLRDQEVRRGPRAFEAARHRLRPPMWVTSPLDRQPGGSIST